MNVKGKRFKLDVEGYNHWYLSQPIHNSGTFDADENTVIGECEEVAQNGTPAIRVNTEYINAVVPQRFLQAL